MKIYALRIIEESCWIVKLLTIRLQARDNVIEFSYDIKKNKLDFFDYNEIML